MCSAALGNERTSPLVQTRVKPDGNLLYPLNEFYEQAGLSLPPVIRVEGQEIPEPCRSLLVNRHDMTPTLENACGRSLQLRVLGHVLADNVLSRQVVLIPEGAASPAAFGAIKIYLEHFPAPARKLILELKQPLGTILRSQKISHASRPDAYFRVEADAMITGALGLTPPRVLYGRRNTIADAAKRPLARVVEILHR
jgi:chorismate-pyruvate lyase